MLLTFLLLFCYLLAIGKTSDLRLHNGFGRDTVMREADCYTSQRAKYCDPSNSSKPTKLLQLRSEKQLDDEAQGLDFNSQILASEVNGEPEEHSCNLDDQTCPTWFQRIKGSYQCRCGSELNGCVYCDQTLCQVYILSCYTMTYDSATNTLSAGASVYGCFQNTSHSGKETIYNKLPLSATRLNNATCDILQRTGQLCGDCKDGHMQSSYSQSLKCVRCTYSRWNWLWYLLVAYVPLTVFFILIIGFGFSAASPEFNAFIIFAQGISAPVNVRVSLTTTELHTGLSPALPLVKILVTIYGIWNLDFFRTLVPPICLNVSYLQGISLDYAIGFYPLLLIATTYASIKLFQCKFHPVKLMCRPFRQCCAVVRRQWSSDRLIEAFVTFLILSYMKIVGVSFDILVPTRVYDINGSSLLYLYYNSSIKYFGEEHFLYAIFAIGILLMFNVLPLLLVLLYPLRCFQRCLARCKLQSLALTTFMDAFHGHYKDGTNDTRDYRYFGAMFFVVQLLSYVIYACTLSAIFYVLWAMVLILVAIVINICKPYKSALSNIIAADLMFLMAMFAISYALVGGYVRNTTMIWFAAVMAFLLALVPLGYITGLILYKVIHCKKLPQRFMHQIRNWWRNRVFQEMSLPLLNQVSNTRRYGAGVANTGNQ